MMTEKQKAKRQLKGFDFTKGDARLSLVGPSVGGPANGIPTLIAKANNFSTEFIKKAQEVQITMELPAFLEKFFYIWGEDAKFLAGLMGWVEPPEDEVQEAKDEYRNWVEDRFTSFSIIKSLHEAKNLPEALSQLTEQDYLDVLTDQVEIEKALKEFDEKSEASTKVEKQVEAPASKRSKTKEKQMTQEAEMVEKSALVELQKSLEDQKVSLEKALAQVKQYEEEKKQAIVKSKTDAVKAVVKDEKQAAVVVKAAMALEDQSDFDALVAVFKSMNELIEKSAMFKEIGAEVHATEDAKKNGVLEIIKSQAAKK
ncbi:MAG: hypothetical protein ABFD50_07210 [Smithella sp.]